MVTLVPTSQAPATLPALSPGLLPSPRSPVPLADRRCGAPAVRTPPGLSTTGFGIFLVFTQNFLKRRKAYLWAEELVLPLSRLFPWLRLRRGSLKAAHPFLPAAGAFSERDRAVSCFQRQAAPGWAARHRAAASPPPASLPRPAQRCRVPVVTGSRLCDGPNLSGQPDPGFTGPCPPPAAWPHL